MAVVIFDSQENAQAWVDGPAPPGDAPITREDSEVVAVVAPPNSAPVERALGSVRLAPHRGILAG